MVLPVRYGRPSGISGYRATGTITLCQIEFGAAVARLIRPEKVSVEFRMRAKVMGKLLENIEGRG